MGAELKRRGRNWSVKYNVPNKLARQANRKIPWQVWRTLGTADKAEAERKQHRVIAEILDEVEAEIAAAGVITPQGLLNHASALSEFHNDLPDSDPDSFPSSALMSDHIERYLAAKGISEDEPLPAQEKALIDRAYSRLTGVERHRVYILSDSIEDWLKELEAQGRSEKTVKWSRRVAEDFLKFSGDILLDHLTQDLAARWVTERVRPLDQDASSKRQRVNRMIAFTNFCKSVGRQLGTDDPFFGQKKRLPDPKGKKQKNRQWTDNELGHIDTLDPSEVLYQLLALAAFTGCRREELVQLKKDDVDLDQRILHVMPEGDGKTESATRDVPIHSELVPLVQWLVDHVGSDGYLLTGLKENDRGESAGDKFRYWRDREIGQNTGLTIHGLRRTFVNHCEQAGVPEPSAALIVGHKHARRSMTYGGYSKDLPIEQKVEIVDSLTIPLKVKVPT